MRRSARGNDCGRLRLAGNERHRFAVICNFIYINHLHKFSPDEDNICEGVVIRPKEPLYIPNGSRILIKSKNARFAEKKAVKHEPKQPRIIADEVSALFTLADDFFTEPRLDNVKSHIGEVSFPRDLGRVSGLLAKDVLEDFLKENAEAYNNLAKQEQKTLNGLLNQRAIDFIKGIIGMP